MKFFENKSAPSQYFQKNTTMEISIPLNGKIDVGYVVLDGDVTIADPALPAVPAAGTLKGLPGPAGLIKEVRVDANPAPGSRYPGGPVVKMSPIALLYQAILQQTKFINDLFGQTFTPAAGAMGDPGVYAVHTEIPIFFTDFNKRRGMLTQLNGDPRAYDYIALQIDTGDLSTIMVGTNRSIDTTALKVSWRDERYNLPGDRIVLFQEDHRQLIAAAQTDLKAEGLRKEGAYLDWMLLTEVGASQILADTLLNKLTINSSARDIVAKWEEIRAKMFRDGWYDASQDAVGQFFIDLCLGDPALAVPATDIKAEIDTNMVSAANVDALRFITKRILFPNGYDSAVMAEYKTK